MAPEREIWALELETAPVARVRKTGEMDRRRGLDRWSSTAWFPGFVGGGAGISVP